MKVQIIGVGEVGSQIAYTCLICPKEITNIVLYDTDQEKLEGQYKDLIRVKKIAGIKKDVEKAKRIEPADVHIISIGRKREIGEEDKYLFASNWGKVLKCFQEISTGKIIVVTNPSKLIADSLKAFQEEKPNVEVFHAGDMCDKTKIEGMEIQRLKGYSSFGIAIETYLML